MLFSSNTFLYIFLPLVTFAVLLAPIRARNAILLVASLIFYAWGETEWTWVLLASILWNWLLGLAIGERTLEPLKRRKVFFAVGLAGNVAALAWFKYAAFLITTFNEIAHAHVPVPEIHLPLGISFFTFHCVSYLIDIYRGEMQPQRNLPRLSLYICLFPQLIAGPIIRYKEIGGQLNARRSIQLRDVSVGLTRFVQGLAKKVLVANILG